MASENSKHELGRPRYELETYSTSTRDDNASFTVRRNGKAFYIEVSPLQFVDSPATTEKYLSYLEVLRSGEEVIGDIYETDVFDWVTRPFEALFADLAPSPAPASYKVTLQEYFYPEFFVFALDVVGEELRPRRIQTTKSPYGPQRVWLDETWTVLYDPAGIILSYDNPEDALFKSPRKVLIDSGQTACFFKPCYSTVQTTNELRAYKQITTANLDPQLHICRLHGVVMDDHGFVMGLLLTYIDHGGRPLCTRVDPDEPPTSVRRQWVDELDTAITELHKAGIVWGDVKAENVLVDKDDHAWITDFGGGYTRGWVDERLAGTVEGDLAGMAKLREYIFQDEAQDRWWTR